MRVQYVSPQCNSNYLRVRTSGHIFMFMCVGMRVWVSVRMRVLCMYDYHIPVAYQAFGSVWKVIDSCVCMCLCLCLCVRTYNTPWWLRINRGFRARSISSTYRTIDCTQWVNIFLKKKKTRKKQCMCVCFAIISLVYFLGDKYSPISSSVFSLSNPCICFLFSFRYCCLSFLNFYFPVKWLVCYITSCRRSIASRYNSPSPGYR